jgi:hypothetical protein
MNQPHLSSDTLVQFPNQQTQQFEYSILEPGRILFCVIRTKLKQMSSNFTSEPEPDAIICEIATKIKNLTPEQLALVLVKSAKGGLSSDHLSFMITASDQILKKRQILEFFQS